MIAIPSYVARTVVSFGQGVLGNAADIVSKFSGPFVATSGYILENAPSCVSAVAFTTLAYHGIKMASVPFKSKAKWINVENRFKKKPEIKAKPINLTELANKSSLTALADITSVQAKKIADEKTTAATEAQTLADNAYSIAINPQNQIDENTTNQLLATANDLQKKADEAKKAAELASERLKNIENITKPKKEETPSPDNFMVTYTLEMSKPKPGQTHILIPLSDEAIIISHEDLRKEFTSLAAGISMVGVGLLGFIDSTPRHVSSSILSSGWAWTASLIGTPVHLVSNTVGYTLGWVARNDHYGLGKLIAAGGLSFSSYKLYRNTKLVWFNFAKNKGGPLVDTDVIIKDIAKLAASVTLFTASVLTANEFIKGN